MKTMAELTIEAKKNLEALQANPNFPVGLVGCDVGVLPGTDLGGKVPYPAIDIDELVDIISNGR